MTEVKNFFSRDWEYRIYKTNSHPYRTYFFIVGMQIINLYTNKYTNASSWKFSE